MSTPSFLSSFPGTTRVLAAAFGFRDIFYSPFDADSPLIQARLEVSIPKLGWTAVGGTGDFTYRFSHPAGLAPSGPFDVTVVAKNGEYVSLESIVFTLPLPASVPPLPTPPKRSDFLLLRPLWPTRSLRVSDGETAVIGRVVDATAVPVGDAKVLLFSDPTPAPDAPYTRTDTNGEFLFRFPKLAGALGGGAVSLNVQIFGPGALLVSPATLSVPLGKTEFVEFVVS